MVSELQHASLAGVESSINERKTLLVQILNKSGPLPNVSAIQAHNPDSVLVIKVNTNYRNVEKKLDENFKRIIAWNDGKLPEFFEFEENTPLPYPPSIPRKIQISKIEVNDISSDSELIVNEINRLSTKIESANLILDLSAGRKEDVANLIKLRKNHNLECSLWYTDSNTGESVEIGGDLRISSEKPVDQVTKFWLDGIPILGVNREISNKNLDYKLLSQVLDGIESVTKNNAQAEEKRNKLCEYLEKNGIEYEQQIKIEQNDLFCRRESYIRFSIKSDPEKHVDVPSDIFSQRKGEWLEHIVALATLEGWGVDKAYIGLAIGSPKHKDRMATLGRSFGRPNNKKILGITWARLFSEGILPHNLHDISKIIKQPNDFTEWLIENWREIPEALRGQLLVYASRRELDVLTEGSLEGLFIECGLTPSEIALKNKTSQIGSLVNLTALRRFNLSIYCHSHIDSTKGRTSPRDFVCSWSDLRNRQNLINLDIGPIRSITRKERQRNKKDDSD